VDTLVQEMSYCETPFPLLFGFACAVLYAVPPLPPFRLTVPGSLWTEPGDVAELPGLDVLPWQLAPWGLGLAYAGAAPITAMVTMQLAESSLCLIFTLRFWVRRAAHPTGYTMSMGIWFNDVPGVLDYVQPASLCCVRRCNCTAGDRRASGPAASWWPRGQRPRHRERPVHTGSGPYRPR
jgi:hypothetical protein